MKKLLLLIWCMVLASCTSLTYQEKQTIRSMKSQGIGVDMPVGAWERPANPIVAGMMNILPGGGNFYLASGNGAQSEHYMYGFLNLLTWPFSILWGVPEAAYDANRINERELIYFYTYDETGSLALKERGLRLNNRGVLEKI